MPAQTGYYNTLKSAAGKVLTYLNTITFTGTDGKTITVTQDTSLDEAVAMSSKAPKASPSFTGNITVEVGSVYKGTYPGGIDDDSVYSFTPGTNHGIVIYHDTNGTGRYGVVSFYTATPRTLAIVLGSNTEIATGALNGTTGVDGKVTISCHTDGKVYIENRSGAGMWGTFAVIAGAQI